jgi:hypothetical protein
MSLVVFLAGTFTTFFKVVHSVKNGNSTARAVAAASPRTSVSADFRTAHIPPNERLFAQLIEQRFRLFEVRGVEAFGEPAVNVGQDPLSFALLPLCLPQASQARGRAQFQRLRVLLAPNV